MNFLAPLLFGNGANAQSNPQKMFLGSGQDRAFLSLYRQQMQSRSMLAANNGTPALSPMVMGSYSPQIYGMILPPVVPMSTMMTSYFSLQRSMFGGVSANYGGATIGDFLRILNPDLANSQTAAAEQSTTATSGATNSVEQTTAASSSPLLAALQSGKASQPQEITDKFAKRIEQLAKQGVTDVALTVDNPAYGPIGVDLKIDATGGVDLTLQTENQQLADWLSGLKSQMQQSLENRGLSLNNLTVDTSTPPESVAFNQNAAPGQSAQGPRAPFNLIEYYLAQAMNQNAMNFVTG